MSQDSLFDNPGQPIAGDDELLIAVYARQGRTLDDLPYTDEFEAIYVAYCGEGDAEEPHGDMTKAALFHRLHNLRKAGKLPRLGRAAAAPPRVEPDQEQLLVQLVEQEIERLSLRDQLLYTDAFDRIVDRFNTQAGLNVSPHDLWRIIAKLAK